MLLHKNVAVQERICRGKALTKILPVYDESMKGGVDVFSIRIQELCQLSLWTGSQLYCRGRKKTGVRIKPTVVWRGENPTRLGSLPSPYFIFFALVGSLLTDSDYSPKLTRSLLDTDQISWSPVRVTTFILTNNCHFRGKMFGIFAHAFLWLNRQSALFNGAFRVEKVNLAMYLLLFTWRVIGENNSPWCVI